MKSALKLLATTVLNLMLVNVALQTAVAHAGEAPGTPDALCDYCKDYTDAATSPGEIRSRYSPGTGYPAEPESDTASAMRKQQESVFEAQAKTVNDGRDAARQ